MRVLLSLIICVALAGCTAQQVAPPVVNAGLNIAASGAGFKVIYTFPAGVKGYNGIDGTQPDSSLAVLDGDFHGTTANGGTVCAGSCTGVAYSITPLGHLRSAFSFHQTDRQGWLPSDIIAMNGKLYGTTIFGPEYECCGQVFEIRGPGKYRVLYNFTGASDGGYPYGITSSNGMLYGTTSLGGDPACNCGTVFSITPSGKFRTLHDFHGGRDGATPLSSPIEANGILYGTTSAGGNRGCVSIYYAGKNDCGTVYSVTLSGEEHVLHAFAGGTRGKRDGFVPWGGLLYYNGTLYGTADWGAKGTGSGFGTVFALEPSSGSLRTLYHFRGGEDGANPRSSLIVVNSVLYGTTAFGGGGKCIKSLYGYAGCGTIFSLNLDGAERVLHGFTKHEAGGEVAAAPIFCDNALYGTAPGDTVHTFGIVYRLALP